MPSTVFSNSQSTNTPCVAQPATPHEFLDNSSSDMDDSDLDEDYIPDTNTASDSEEDTDYPEQANQRNNSQHDTVSTSSGIKKSASRQFSEMIDYITHNTSQNTVRQTRNHPSNLNNDDATLEDMVTSVILIRRRPLLFSVPYNADDKYSRCFVRLSRDHRGILKCDHGDPSTSIHRMHVNLVLKCLEKKGMNLSSLLPSVVLPKAGYSKSISARCINIDDTVSTIQFDN
jgi:hypothetical protein